MKKLLAILLTVFLSFVFMACEPTTATASLITGITQSTTYIPVTNIDIEADIQEPCQGTVISFTVTVYPSNATDQTYTISINPTYMLSFVAGSNQMQVEVVAEGTSGDITENIVTVTSNDNTSIIDTVSIYVYPTTSSSPACQVN